MGRKYENAEWLQFECEGVDLSKELEKLGEKFGERAIEVATAFLHSQYGPELGRHGINYDDDALIWNTYASVVGHGVGLWEEDGDTGLPPELEGKLDKIVRKDKKLVSLADQIQGECAGLKQDAGVEERRGLKAADFPDFFDAIESAVEKMGATHQDTRMGHNVSVFIPWGDGTFEQKTLFFKNGLWHWPARGKEVKKLPDYAAAIDQAWIDQQRARVPYLRYGAEARRGGGPLHAGEREDRFLVTKGALAGKIGILKPLRGTCFGGDYGYPLEIDGQIYTLSADMVRELKAGTEAGEADTNWAVEWINPTTKKRQIYLDDMSQRQADIEARTLRMHHPNADVRVVRRGFESREAPQGGEPSTVKMWQVSLLGSDGKMRSAVFTTEKAAGQFAGKHSGSLILKVDVDPQTGRIVNTTREESPRVVQPSAHRSSEAREASSIHAEGDAVPWVRITRDPKLYEEGIKRAKEIGPIDSGRQIYELLSPALSEENQEVFLVVLCNLRQECIGVAEVHRGERSRVSVSRADILQVVTKSGADHFHVVHNHPSGDPTPSPADRKLTEAIQDGAAEVEIPCVDHVVIGMGKFYSFAEGKVVSVR